MFDWVLNTSLKQNFFVFYLVFFHEHSRFTGQQGKGEGVYLTPLYHFHLVQGHLVISRAISAESSPLHIASCRTRLTTKLRTVNITAKTP